MNTTSARQILSVALLCFYGAIAGAYIGTVTLWIVGIVPGFVGGLIYGAVRGAKTPLRDAVILVCGGFGSVFALLWLKLVFELKTPIDIIGLAMIFVASGVLHLFAQPRLAFQTRYWLACASIAFLVFNFALLLALQT